MSGSVTTDFFATDPLLGVHYAINFLGQIRLHSGKCFAEFGKFVLVKFSAHKHFQNQFGENILKNIGPVLKVLANDKVACV